MSDKPLVVCIPSDGVSVIERCWDFNTLEELSEFFGESVKTMADIITDKRPVVWIRDSYENEFRLNVSPEFEATH